MKGLWLGARLNREGERETYHHLIRVCANKQPFCQQMAVIIELWAFRSWNRLIKGGILMAYMYLANIVFVDHSKEIGEK